jgi:hypothetical protein
LKARRVSKGAHGRTSHPPPIFQALAPSPMHDDDYESDEEEEDTTDICPYCKQAIYDDTIHCPHCGEYISEEDRPTSTKPWWILAGVGICLYIIYRWSFG